VGQSLKFNLESDLVANGPIFRFPTPVRFFSGLGLGIGVAACCLFLGCSNSPTKRGAIAPDDRADFIENYGDLNWEIRKAFIDGKVVPGMAKDLVIFLAGNPDRTATETFGVSWGKSSDSLAGQEDTQANIWEYLDPSTGEVRLGLRFQNDTVSNVRGQVE